MRQTAKLLTRLFPAFLLVALGFSQAVHPQRAMAAATPGCYSEARELDDNGLYSDTETVVEKFPVCARGMEQMGFVLTDLPADFPNPEKCYFFSADTEASGVELPCDDPKIANAEEYGSQTPPPPSIDDASEEGSISNPERNQACSGKDCITDNPMVKLVLFAINFFGALVGVIVIIVIVWSGILYASAGSNPNQVAEAKKHITNAIIALVMYLFLFAFLQWLVPGGVLS